MFQLAPVQLPHSLLREIHCCCGPAPTLPSMSESDIQPPLAQPPFWCSTMSPRMCMRRKGDGLRDGPLHGAAGGRDGEAFHGAPEGAGGVVAGRLASEWTLPVMWTASGDAPRPSDLGVEADGNIDVVLAGEEEEGVALRGRTRCAAGWRRPSIWAWMAAAGMEGSKTRRWGRSRASARGRRRGRRREGEEEGGAGEVGCACGDQDMPRDKRLSCRRDRLRAVAGAWGGR